MDMRIILKLSVKLSTYEIEENDAFVCAIGNPKTKEKCTNMILERGGEFSQSDTSQSYDRIKL